MGNCLSNKVEPTSLSAKNDSAAKNGLTKEVGAVTQVAKAQNGIIQSTAAPTRPVNSCQTSSLIGAVKKNDIESIKQLVQNGADINARGSWENTPLIFACQYGNVDAARTLIDLGADTTALNEKGVTALLLCCLEGLEDIADACLANKSQTVDLEAARAYNSATDTNCMLTPLLAACLNGYGEIVRSLIAKGADVNRSVNTSTNGFNSAHNTLTPLMGAALADHSEVVQILLDNGASIDAVGSTEDCKQCSALLLACKKGHMGTATLLLAKQANTCVGDSTGNTPLHELSSRGEHKLASKFISAGANVNAPNKKGQTPLFVACSKAKPGQTRYEDTVSVLLASGADSTVQTSTSDGAEQIAIKRKCFNIVKLLQENTAAISAANPQSDASGPIECQPSVSVSETADRDQESTVMSSTGTFQIDQSAAGDDAELKSSLVREARRPSKLEPIENP